MKDSKMLLFPDKARRWVLDYNKGEKAKKRHRDNGPAVIAYDSSQYWYTDNVINRKDGPAIVLPKSRQYDSKPMHGYQAWYKNGIIHREQGRPSQLWATGDLDFYVNGKLHREDGPAVIRNTPEKTIEFWLDGKQQTFMCILDKDGNYDKSEEDKLPDFLKNVYKKWTVADTMAEISLYHKEAVEFMKEAHRFTMEVGKMVHKTEDYLDDEEDEDSDEDMGSFDDEDMKESKHSKNGYKAPLDPIRIDMIEDYADGLKLTNEINKFKASLDLIVKTLSKDDSEYDGADIEDYINDQVSEVINKYY